MTSFAPPPKPTLHHIALLVDDLPRAESFYRDCLGFSVERRWPGPGDGDRSVWLCLNHGARLMLERSSPGHPRRAPQGAGWHLIALTIPSEDRANWKAHLERHNVPVIEESEFSLYIEDPEGNRVALSHWPEPMG